MRPSPQRHIAMQPYRRMPECLTALIAGVMLCFSTGSVCAQAPKPPPATPDKPADKPAEAVPLNLEQEMQALLNDAQTNFNLGKYDVALQKLGAIHSKTNNKDFENVIFMEGACYYQMQQFDKAADTLQAFMTKFPKSEMAPDAALALGRAQLKKGDENKGVATLKKAAADYPARKAEAGVELANYFKGKSKPDEAIAILENITKDAQMTAEMVQGYLIMAEIYASKGETEKAAAAMEKLKSSAADDDTIIQRNLLGIKLGDEMRQKQMYREALTAYQSVRRQSEILRIQKNRIARIEQWQKQVAAGQRVFFLGHSLGKSDLDQMLDANKKILEEIEKNKNFDADLYFRLGQCFFEMKRFYEAVVALQRVYDEFKDYERRDIALYCMIASYQNLEREGKAYDLCEKYMKDFP